MTDYRRGSREIRDRSIFFASFGLSALLHIGLVGVIGGLIEDTQTIVALLIS